MKVYYSPYLRTIAQKLRRNSTRAEIILWKYLKRKQALGCDFNRQKPIGKFIVDFYCSKLKLAIEVDGYSHHFDDVARKDEEKSKYLESLGISLLRFTDEEVRSKIPNVLRSIEMAITETTVGHTPKSPFDRGEDTSLDPLLIEGKMGTVVAVCLSRKKGEIKRPVDTALLVAGHGIEGDAHAGDWHRQVSLLAEESVDKMRGRGVELTPGIFAENLLTRGLDLAGMKVGARLRVGESVVLEITQIGKECHQGCAIRELIGDCVMPREGVFARVVEGGEVRAGDGIVLV